MNIPEPLQSVTPIRLPQQDSSTGRAIKTFLQALIGFAIGLVLVVWAVPGVPEAVVQYVQNNFVQVLLTAGIPAGITSFVWNLSRKNIPNY